MAIEKSALNYEIIKDLLLQEYNITINKLEKLKEGSANCYKVFSFDAIYFLKEFQGHFTSSNIEEEANLLEFLVENQFPTTNIIKTRYSKNYTVLMNKIVCLQKYINGTTYQSNTVPNGILFESAQLLGKLHTILKNYKRLVYEMDSNWYKEFSAFKSAESYQLLLDSIDRTETELHHIIYNDLIYKQNLQYKIAGYGEFFDAVTYGNTHGDFNCLQYVCDENHISAVIDFSSACCMPLCWDIMRSYVQSAPECIDGDFIDIPQLVQYIKHYLTQGTLTKNDLKYMPYIYFYQLARSKYGYKEFLANYDNKYELIKFGFWRTNMCRYLEANVREISKVLSAIL